MYDYILWEMERDDTENMYLNMGLKLTKVVHRVTEMS